jgi:hypothetical protein
MSEHFSYEAYLFIKSQEEIENFGTEILLKKMMIFIYTFVGNEGIEKVLMQEFENAVKAENEDAKIVNDIFYWQVPKEIP